MRIALFTGLGFALLLAVFASVDFGNFSLWIINQQRALQNQMATALWSLRSGEWSAYLALFAATGGYGFVHALGPGHGKYLVGGVGLGSSVSTGRLVGLAVASSLMQSVWAIVLVYGGFALLEVSADSLQFLSEDVLAPASYAAIGLIGVVLAWRGYKSLVSRKKQSAHSGEHAHHDGCGCGHSHGPTPEQAANVGTLKEAVILVSSIAVRPCTGAVFLLIIAWQTDIKLAGAMAIMVMGLGTALLTGLVAVSSVASRQLAFFSADRSGVAQVAVPAAQIIAGALIFWFSIGLLMVVY